MLFRFIAGLSLFAWLSLGISAAPKEFSFSVDAASTSSSNFSEIVSGFCGTSGACALFQMPAYAGCVSDITTCSCTATVNQALATCIQCGFDNVAGLNQSTAQQYLSDFDTACSSSATQVQAETIVVHSNGAGTQFGASSFIAMWVMVSALGMSLV